MPQITSEQHAARIANLKRKAPTEIIPIDPESISITGIEGVGGGGDLTVNRTLHLEIQGLTAPDPFTPAQSYIAIYDTTDGTHRKIPASEVASAGADKHYTHVQSVAASIWSVMHNLSKHPSVITVDSADTQMIGQVEYIDLNNIEIRFSAPYSGKAYFN